MCGVYVFEEPFWILGGWRAAGGCASKEDLARERTLRSGKSIVFPGSRSCKVRSFERERESVCVWQGVAWACHLTPVESKQNKIRMVVVSSMYYLVSSI